jgi:mRNA-degrading endonuclease RelE of RelBE toxin-antitoxin system
MAIYEVHRTQVFDQKLENFPDDFKKQIGAFEEQLTRNPYVGKPLGVKWFREKKIGKHRMYYLIYEDIQTAYIITLSAKKDQQKIINTIKLFLDKYREEIENMTT